ncbi:hypothetical protein B0H21DRAFT_819076 [Amylocystis lapponica]|nr:hypothetical protein B0H21DRAFT_819076 [Amylocystis lapponica]
MQVDSPQQYTILRIKRKRNEEPLDALVVDSRPRRKKSRGTMNVFQFAETVEQAAWDDEQQKKDLQTRLSSLARESSQQSSPNVVPAPALAPAPAIPTSQGITTATPPVQHAPQPQGEDLSRRYTIVQPDKDGPPSEPGSRRRAPTAPPKVWSSKELQAAKSAFRMYDAVPSSSTLASLASATSAGSVSTAGEDAEMAKFLPMLQDYLKLNDTPLASELPPGSTLPSASAAVNGVDDDYVWDVFYQRPTTFQQLFEPSQSGNIGTLTGLPAELSGLYDSDSDSEWEDEDDEDSNAEDWYTNDYPDEDDERSVDSEGSDVFHEDSDEYADALDQDSEHEWR